MGCLALVESNTGLVGPGLEFTSEALCKPANICSWAVINRRRSLQHKVAYEPSIHLSEFLDPKYMVNLKCGLTDISRHDSIIIVLKAWIIGIRRYPTANPMNYF